MLVLLLCILYSSCSSIDFELPQGPQGPNGKSAYEIWKEEVEAGHIDWPSDKINLTDFLVYIKGEKGDKGADGMSAYEQWKAMLAQGNVTNPHDPSQNWPSSKIQNLISGISSAEGMDRHLISAKTETGTSVIKIPA